jgi:hypothetical protein
VTGARPGTLVVGALLLSATARAEAPPATAASSAAPVAAEPLAGEPAPVMPASEGAPPSDAPVEEESPAEPPAPAEPAPLAQPPAPARAAVAPGTTLAPAPRDAASSPTGRRRGFFIEAAMGPGFFFARTSAADARTFTGGSLAVQVALGGTIARGFVLGGAYMHDEIFGMSSSDEITDGDEPNLDGVGFSLQRVGLFGDFFPDPTGGLHFQGFAGLGVLNTRRRGVSADDPDGPILSLAGGYSWRLGSSSYVGALVRLTAAPFSSSETTQGEDSTNVVTPALLGTATFH